MRNQYPGLCRDCRAPVPAGEGYFHKRQKGRGFDVRCIPCVAQDKAARGAPLSLAQAQALKGDK